MVLLVGIAAYFAVTWALGRIAAKVYETKLSWPFALLIDCGAAYAVGFSIEILLLQLTNEIPGGQSWPVFTWAIFAVTGFVIAARWQNPTGHWPRRHVGSWPL